MASEFDWTAEAVALLTAFWDEGHATAEIGRRMGISKSAVIGKAHRLGLPPRPSPIHGKNSGERPCKRARIRPPKPSLPPLRPATDDTPPPAVPAKPTAAPAARPPPRGEPCCWPIGEPDTRGFRMCGAPAQPRKPYCAEHAQAAYVPMQAARGRPDGPNLDRSLRRIIRTA